MRAAIPVTIDVVLSDGIRIPTEFTILAEPRQSLRHYYGLPLDKQAEYATLVQNILTNNLTIHSNI